MSKIQCSHKDPVAAGTIVRFNVPDPGVQPGDRFTWTVRGPRSTDVTTVVDNESFDWDTSGLTAGAYDVNARRLPTTPTESGGVSPTDDQAVAAQQKQEQDPDLAVAEWFSATAGVEDVQALSPEGQEFTPFRVSVVASPATTSGGVLPVSLQRTSVQPTDDQILWVVIRNRTNAIGFRSYKRFIDGVMDSGQIPGEPTSSALRGPHSYELLKQATDAFLLHEAGVVDGRLNARATIHDFDAGGEGNRLRADEKIRLGRDVSGNELEGMRARYYQQLGESEPGMLPYLRNIQARLIDLPLKTGDEVAAGAYGILPSTLAGPLAMELIWSYWQEEGMLVQTLNAVLARFQNRGNGARDPLARFDLDPLRPLSNIFWGWSQDELRRLTVRRRSFEYEHEYGLRLLGKAVPNAPVATDRRSKFLEALHNLLYLSHIFFKEDDDTTIMADGFPLLNALRETHLVLAEGAHNQFGDLPSTARAEMLIMQWLLARPEMREFLGGRVMVPYEEPWMDRVDTMKTMQGWGDTSITHFRDMAVFGEQLLLSIRYGDWSTINMPQQAANWARYWRPEIQRYTHAYRSATGVDLTDSVNTTSPGVLLRRRLQPQTARRA